MTYTPTMKRKPTSAEAQQAELEKLDLLPESEAQERTDHLLRAMLARPPDPFTPKNEKSTKPLK